MPSLAARQRVSAGMTTRLVRVRSPSFAGSKSGEGATVAFIGGDGGGAAAYEVLIEAVRCGVPRWCYALRRRELVLRGRVTARGA